MPRTRKSPPADPPASSGAGRRARGPSNTALESRVCELEQRIVVLERAVRTLMVTPQAAPVLTAAPDASPGEPDLRGEVLLDAIRSIDREARLDGLVPIPWLRRRFPSCGHPQLDRALLDLEKGFRIDLKIANDPLAVEAAGEGIQHPLRGLLYYAVMR